MAQSRPRKRSFLMRASSCASRRSLSGRSPGSGRASRNSARTSGVRGIESTRTFAMAIAISWARTMASGLGARGRRDRRRYAQGVYEGVQLGLDPVQLFGLPARHDVLGYPAASLEIVVIGFALATQLGEQ